jgi:hypothetical protein
MATEVIKVVDPDMGSGYDYDSLYDWEAAQQGDLTGVRNEISVAKCRCTAGTADTTQVYLSGWTCSSTQYPKIWTDPSESYRHNGTWQTGNKYRFETSNADDYGITVYNNYFRLIGLQIRNTSGSPTNYYNVGMNGDGHGDYCLVESCILRGTGTNSTSYCGGVINWGAVGVKVINCIAYDFLSSGGIGYGFGTLSASDMYAYNCTAQNCNNGYIKDWGAGVWYLTNCIAAACTNGFDVSGGSGSVTSYCASDMSDGLSGTGDRNSQTFSFVDAGADNFHLASNDTGALGYGLNLYNDANFAFQTDIDGQDRGGSGATWDIGADEYISDLIASISVNDVIGVLEDKTVTLSTVPDRSINTYDSTTCSEQVTGKVSDSVISVYDATGVTEYIVSTVSAPAVSIFDTCSVLESVTIVVAGLTVSVNDSVSAQQDVTASVGTLVGSVYDSTSITEFITNAVSALPLVVFETATLAEYVSLTVSTLGVVAVETVTADQYCAATVSSLLPSAVDWISLSESAISTVSTPYTSVFDNVVISEQALVDVEQLLASSEISVQDTLVVSESCTLLMPTYLLTTYDSAIVTDVVVSEVWPTTVIATEYVSVAELSSVSVSACLLSVVDDIVISEITAVFVSDIKIDVVEYSSVSDIVVAVVSSLIISSFDSALVTEARTVYCEEAVEDIDSNVQDTTTVSESCALLIPTYLLTVYDSTTATDVVVSEVWPTTVVITEYIGVTEFSSVLVSACLLSVIDSLTVTDVTAVHVPDIKVVAVDYFTVSDVVVSDVYPTTVVATEYISVSEYSPVFVEVTNLFNVQDSVSVGESTGAQVSDLPGSVFDTVTLTEQAAAEIRLQVSASELVGVTEQVVLAPPAINAAVADYVSVEDQVIFTQDLVVSIYDPAQVQEAVNGALESGIGVYDSILVDAVTFARPEISLGLSIFETVTVYDAVTMFSGHISLSVIETVTVAEQVIIYWTVADGLLVIDCDVIVPLIASELMCPELMCGVDSPKIEVQMT